MPNHPIIPNVPGQGHEFEIPPSIIEQFLPSAAYKNFEKIKELIERQKDIKPEIRICCPSKADRKYTSPLPVIIQWASVILEGSLKVLVNSADITSTLKVDEVNCQAEADIDFQPGKYTLSAEASLLKTILPMAYVEVKATIRFFIVQAPIVLVPERKFVIVQQSGSTDIYVKIRRHDYTGAVNCSIYPLPAGMEHFGGTALGNSPAKIQLQAGPSVPLDTYNANIIGHPTPPGELLPTSAVSIKIRVVPKLRLLLPPRLIFKRGQTIEVEVGVLDSRDDIDDVTIALQNLPVGFAVFPPDACILKGIGTAKFRLTTSETATIGDATIEVNANTHWLENGQNQTIEEQIAVSILPPVVGLALGGGGAKGDFQFGAIQYLYGRGVCPQIISGTSVGALNAVGLAQGADGLQKLESVWLSMEYETDMFVEEPWMSEIQPALSRVLPVVIGTGEVFVSFGTGAIWTINLVDAAVAAYAGVSFSEIEDAWNHMSSAKSFYNLSPIRQKLSANVDLAKVSTSGIKLRMTAVCLESGDLSVITESGKVLDSKGNYIATVNVLDGAIASASIPAAFPWVKLGQLNYVDGGVREVVPIRTAVDAGASLIFAILCSYCSVNPSPSFDSKNILDCASRSLLDIMANEVEVNDLYPATGWPAEIVVIKPYDFLVHDTYTIDPGLIRISMAYGFMCADDAYPCMRTPSEKAQLSSNTLQIAILRKEIWYEEHSVFGKKYPTERSIETVLSDLKSRANDGIWPFGEDPPETIMTYNLDALDWVREAKRRLKLLVLERRRLGGAVPNQAEDWWNKWEAHQWRPASATPWGEFGDRPAVSPP